MEKTAFELQTKDVVISGCQGIRQHHRKTLPLQISTCREQKERGGEKMIETKEFRMTTISVMVVLFVLSFWSLVMAITAPAAGSFAYDIYDIAVDRILKGPIGFVGGMIAMVVGAISAIQARILLAIPAILGGALLLKADSIVTSLGMIV
jgi:hypothetical protein